MIDNSGNYSYISLDATGLSLGIVTNDWQSNPVALNATYDETVDAHIFLPCTESSPSGGRYTSTHTGWNPSSPGNWNDLYYTLSFGAGTGQPILSKIAVYLGSVIRPVCDRNEGN